MVRPGRGWCVRPWTSPWPSRLVVGRHGRQNKAGHPRANLIDRTKIAKSIKNRSLFLKSKCTSLYMNILSIITNLIIEGRSSSTEALGIGNRMQLSQRSSKSDAAAVSHKKYCCFLLKIQHRASSHIITMKISSLLLLCTL